MAHFAKLDDNNIVMQVIVISNDSLDPNAEETSGIEFLTQWSGGHRNWKQTSYNAKFRKNYAAMDYEYDSTRDAFIPPKCHESAQLNEDTCIWECNDETHIIPRS